MASEVGICNSALVKIGASRIVALDEGSKNANLCGELYPKLRDDLLRSHTWNFATVRAKLAQLATTPEFGFAHEYQLPSDWVRTVSVHDNDAGAGAVEYRIEGRKLRASAGELYLRYVRVVTDVNEMPADFREALALLLARDVAVPIAQSNALRESMADSFREALARAKSTDALEDYPEALPPGSWVTVR
jgi:hypothetical protein